MTLVLVIIVAVALFVTYKLNKAKISQVIEKGEDKVEEVKEVVKEVEVVVEKKAKVAKTTAKKVKK